MLTECMSVIAGAWAPNVIWSLRAGARRFNELRQDIPPISAKVLSARLSELEERGVLVRHVRPTSPPSVEYELTSLGAELIPALDAIVQVGHRLKDIRADVGSITGDVAPPHRNQDELKRFSQPKTA